jgi:DNA-binding NarL/FixJ family response regulator
MCQKRVIVADDLPAVLNTVTELLRPSFNVIAQVSDGFSALNATMKLQPDLVILDISMPEMSGIEVARELKRRASAAKIVFLTVHEDADILRAALAAGGHGYVMKVLMDADLIPAMNEALEDRVFVSIFPA